MVDGLKTLRPGARPEGVAGVGEIGAALEKAAAADGELGAQILEIVVVGDPVVGGVGAPAGNELAGVLETKRGAVVIELAVAGKKFAADESFSPGREVAKLALGLDAAVAHGAQRKRGVVVGRDIEVVGHGGFHAGGAGNAEARH